MSSIGHQLAQVRIAKQLSIEDAAFHTRIPAARLRDLENDDLSRFANLVYARGFLKIYSRYLDVDISDYLDQFSTADFAEVSGHEYVQTARATQNLPAAVFVETGRSRMPGVYILLASTVLVAVIYFLNSGGQESSGDSSAGGERSTNTAAKAEPAKAAALSPGNAAPANNKADAQGAGGSGAAVSAASPSETLSLNQPAPPAVTAPGNQPAREVAPESVPVPGPNGAIKAEVVPE